MKKTITTLCTLVALSVPATADAIIEYYNFTGGGGAYFKITSAAGNDNFRFHLLENQYEVKKGDTLWDIAEERCGDGNKYWMLAEYNRLRDSDKIKIGKVLDVSYSACNGGK
ncbi:LysM peptidoglycan-binding domain-containing protein [Candidatus Woesearchaeota archaeon]|nr:LysM peptidoglycan-binding domain-containing protein [Candidatus Woesearchaeota archaeon]